MGAIVGEVVEDLLFEFEGEGEKWWQEWMRHRGDRYCLWILQGDLLMICLSAEKERSKFWTLKSDVHKLVLSALSLTG